MKRATCTHNYTCTCEREKKKKKDGRDMTSTHSADAWEREGNYLPKKEREGEREQVDPCLLHRQVE